MKAMVGFTVVALGLMAGSLSGASAKEFNQRPHLDPGSQAKVNSVIASGWRWRSAETKIFRRITNQGCGGLTIGDFTDSKRPPREVIIVARDIINISKNC